MKLKETAPSKRHQAFHEAFAKLLDEHFSDLPALEVLAVASYAVGTLIALQDRRKITPDLVMEIVGANIEAGNRRAVEGVLNAKGGTA